MTDSQVRLVIRADDKGAAAALSEVAQAAESSAKRQATSFAKVRAELKKGDAELRRSSRETARQREEDSKKTLAVLIDDVLRAQRIQRKSALDSAAVFVQAERQRTAAAQAGSEQRANATQKDRAALDGYGAALRRTIGLEREAARAASERGNSAAAAARPSGIGSTAGNFLSGVGAAGGIGFGATAAGAGIATALAVRFSSQQAIEFERANAALTAVTGSSTEAGQALAFVREQAERLGVSVTTLSLQYSRFEASAKGTALEGAKTRDIFLAITEAGQRLNLRSEQVEGALNAVSQIISKGSVQAEELRGQLGDRLPGAFNIMARALGVTTRELDKMLRLGEVAANDALPKFAAELRRTFDTDGNTRINTTVSNFTRLTNEIRLASAELGGLINKAAGPAAGGLAKFFERGRQASELRQLGPDAQRRFREQRDKGFSQGTPFKNLGEFLQQEREADPVYQRQLTETRLTEAFAPLKDQIDAARGPEADPTELRTSTRQRLEAQGKVNEATQLEIFLQRQAAGEFAGKAFAIIENYRQIAIAEDANNARLKSARESKKSDAEIERERLRIAKERLEQYAPLERGQKGDLEAQALRNAVLQEELNTGRSVSASRREQIRLEQEFFGIKTQSLEAAQREGVALSDQLDLRRQANQLAAEAIGEVTRGEGRNVRALRKGRRLGGPISGTFAGINAAVSDDIDAENARFKRQTDALNGGDEMSLRADGTLAADQTLKDALVAAEEQHQARLTEIAREGAQQRNDLTRSYLQAGNQILDNLSAAAEASGLARSKRGFEITKAINIAQAVGNTATAITNALAVPPYPLGLALAATAGLAGAAQIAAIRSTKFGGAREFGGNVNREQFFEIGERGKPEVVKSDGRYYLFGAQGNVTPASNRPSGAPMPANGGMGNVSITVNNTAGDLVNARARASRGLNGDQVIELVVAELEDNAGSIGRAASRKFGGGRQGRFG